MHKALHRAQMLSEYSNNFVVDSTDSYDATSDFQLMSEPEYRGEVQDLMLFTSKGCPYCTSFKRSWRALKKTDLPVNFVQYDADKDDNVCRKYKINAVPQLLLKLSNKKKPLKYSGDMNKKDVASWVKKSI